MRESRFQTFKRFGSLLLLLPFFAFGAATTVTDTPPVATPNNAHADQLGGAYLLLQEQIRQAQLSIEQNRKTSEEVAVASARRIAEQLQSLERSLAEQRASEVRIEQQTNHTVVLILAAFTLMCCLAFVLTTYFQWRSMNHMQVISSALLIGHGLNSSHRAASLDGGPASRGALTAVEQSDARLDNAVQCLEKRLQDLERTSPPPIDNPQPPASAQFINRAWTSGSANRGPTRPLSLSLFDKGQSLLDEGKFDEAIACYDELLAQNPNNAQALVKKGSALERLQKLKEALACYDRATALDRSITIT